MKVLLLSAYHARSHEQWCKGLQQHIPGAQFHLMTLPPRHFAWRIRGNALSWWARERVGLEQGYDLLLATSMVDVATLRGLVPNLAKLPCIVYFHENQFAYPSSQHQQGQLEAQMVNLYAACAADKVVFNTQYNCETFLQGVDRLMRKLPDHLPESLAQTLRRKSDVLAVPIRCLSLTLAKPKSTFHVVWNHRWEYDKGPELLYNTVRLLDPQLPLRFHIVGQEFRSSPAVFLQLHELLKQRNWLGRWGHITDEAEYHQCLQASHLVLSTALHDFQGVAVLEAVSAGCEPLVPDRLAYKELFAEHYRYASQLEAENAAAALTRRALFWLNHQQLNVPSVKHLAWQTLAQKYRDLLQIVTNT